LDKSIASVPVTQVNSAAETADVKNAPIPIPTDDEEVDENGPRARELVDEDTVAAAEKSSYRKKSGEKGRGAVSRKHRAPSGVSISVPQTIAEEDDEGL